MVVFAGKFPSGKNSRKIATSGSSWAVELGKDDAVALSRSGHALAHVVGDHEGGVALIDRALSLNPNLSATWFSSGWVRVWSDDPEVAIEHMTRAMRLNPLDPLLWAMRTAIAYAHFFAGRDDQARSCEDN